MALGSKSTTTNGHRSNNHSPGGDAAQGISRVLVLILTVPARLINWLTTPPGNAIMIGYVEPELAHEYELVMVAEAQLTGYLGNLPGESRLNAYRHILRHTRLRNSLKLPPLQDVALAIASPIPPVQPTLPAVESEPAIEVHAEVVEPTVSARSPTNSQQPITNNSQPIAQPAPKLDPTTEQAGQEILDAIVRTRRSTLLIGDTGAGKSVTQAYVLTKLFELQPNADVFVLAQKADSFCGLAEKGRVTLFDPNEPEHALILISNIWILYDRRRRLPESERPALSPVRLILADWLSINQALVELFKVNESVRNSQYLSKLADIIYNGRELNVCLLVDLQSYNLAAVGLKADRNSRKNFDLIGLGNYSVDELGMVNDSYGVLINLIGDRYIVAEESERSALNATFKQLQPISKATRRPIIFSGLSPARLALLPDLRKYKTSVVSPRQPENLNDIRQRLEFLLDTGNDTDTSYQRAPNEGDTDDTGTDTSDTSIDTGNSDTNDTADTTGVSDDTADTKSIPNRISNIELVSLIQQMKDSGLSQTQVIQALWGVQKNRTGWKQAYAEYKELMGEG